MFSTILIAVVILLLIIGLAYGAQKAMAARVLARDGSVEEAQSDASNAIPAVLLIPDDSTAAGDTPDAHDEITPHDLPLSHPGRQAAEKQAAGGTPTEGPESGTTRGDADPSESADDAGERR